MKRMFALLLLLTLTAAPALSEYWDRDLTRPIVCCEDRLGCQVLQMVLMGSFDSIDPGDSLSVRVLSAAYSQVRMVSEEDFSHFTEEFGVDEAIVRRDYYIALGCCLWADILMNEAEDPQEAAVNEVLHLFLDPAAVSGAQTQIDIIRGMADEEIIARLAVIADLPEGFIRYLIQSENWRSS